MSNPADRYFCFSTRDGQQGAAQYTQPVCGVFVIQGVLKNDPRSPHLWRSDGHWQEWGGEHRLDIVTRIPEPHLEAA